MLRTLTGFALTAFLATGLSSAPARGAEPVDDASDPRRAAREMAEHPELSESQKSLIDRPDRQRPEHPISIPVFGRPLTFGGRLSVTSRYEDDRLLDFDFLDLDNRDLDGDGDEDETEDAARGKVPTDDELRITPTLELDLFYPFTPDISIYLEGAVEWRNLVWAEEADRDDEWIVERRETWLYFGNLFGSPLGLQTGRQRFFDEREWWSDEDLDAVRLRSDFERFHAEVAVAEQLFSTDLRKGDTDYEEKDLLRGWASASWSWAERQQVSLVALYQDDHSSRQPLVILEPDPVLPCVPEDEFPPGLPDAAKEFFRSGCPGPGPFVRFEDESDADLAWIGLSASGRLKLGRPGKLYYWLEAAGVRGREVFTDYSGPTGARTVSVVDRHDVSGYGGEAGLTFEFDLPLRPSLSASFAHGSGKSRMTEESDRGFRQTGLQDNNDKFRGVASFRYYGELIDPELSNLRVLTGGVGFRFLRNSSIDFVYHHYQQVHRAPFLRDVDFKRDPNGLHRDIGQELDVILGIEEWQRFEIKLVGAVFQTGKAFAPKDDELSYLAKLRLRLNF
jgi:hypothetical protein